jgi:hypothetical protein
MVLCSSGSCHLLKASQPVGTSGRERRQDLDRRIAPPRRESRARCTSPIPPEPSSDLTS